MRIGNVTVDPPLILGPMAGMNSVPFRLLCRKAGAGLVCSEMVSATALHFGSTKTAGLLESCAQERPLSVQLFGADPDIVAEGARDVEAAGADIVDLNMGCPVRKVLKAGAGSMLMKDPNRAVAIAAATVRAVGVPVTAKLRIGWSREDASFVELSRRLVDAGVAAIALHGRTAGQGYRGAADWSAIARLVQAVSVPVIGNGDVFTAPDAGRMLRETGCAAVMIARGALGNPFLFAQAADVLAGRDPRPIPARWRLAAAVWHVQASALHHGEYLGVRRMRAMSCWYSRGLPGSAVFRREACRAGSVAELSAALLSLAHNLPHDAASETAPAAVDLEDTPFA
ncbi:MAG: tRNA dihydrouridine synthase DusB [Armatimonadetes bacterium]|nr:tRNA dihydrouridine synthase DusB [Armatimonadota bacterium]